MFNIILKMISIGKYSYGQPNILWGNSGAKLIIGSFCSIASNVNIYLGGNHRSDWITTYPFGHINKQVFNSFDGTGHPSTKGDVEIGNDVWIGSNVVIMSGVKIGDGAVIANNSHVVKNIDSYSIVGGNPVMFIKYRFDKEKIDQLLKIKWWEWDDNKINENVSILCSNNLDEFIERNKN